jgi:hypothetical protein
MDRTNRIHPSFSISQIDLINDLPKKPLNADFHDIAKDRIDEIKSKNKSIYLFWSGGIDSTYILAQLLQEKISFTVIGVDSNRLSLLEKYKIPYEEVKFSDFQTKIKQLIDDDCIVLTGHLGDQLFGSGLFKTNNWFDPISSLKNYMMSTINDEVKVDKMIEFIKPAINECPFEIKTLHDYFWWINFSQKYNYVKFHTLTGIDYSKKQFYENIYSFFDTFDFQLWSMNEKNHRELKIQNNIYKYPMIKFIDDNNYSELLVDREKVVSFLMSVSQVTLFTNENFEHHIIPVGKTDFVKIKNDLTEQKIIS